MTDLLDNLDVILRELPLAAGPYALELKPAILRDGVCTVQGTFRGLSALGSYGSYASDPQKPHEETVMLGLADVVREPELGFAFVRAWCSLVQRAFESASTHPLGLSVWLSPHALGYDSIHERFLRQSKGDPAKLASLLEERHPLAAFLGGPPEEYERAHAMLEDELLEQGWLLGRTKELELTLVRYQWRMAGLWMVTQSIVYEPEGMVRDIKEQELLLASHKHFARPERIVALMAALRETLPAHLAKLVEKEQIEALMPSDILDRIDEVLDQKKPVTHEDFVASLRRRWKL